MCGRSPDLLKEYDRLNGTNLMRTGAPINIAIDDATDKYAAEARRFFNFCLDLYSRMYEGA